MLEVVRMIATARLGVPSGNVGAKGHEGSGFLPEVPAAIVD
jgi:hypothetical protein